MAPAAPPYKKPSPLTSSATRHNRSISLLLSKVALPTANLHNLISRLSDLFVGPNIKTLGSIYKRVAGVESGVKYVDGAVSWEVGREGVKGSGIEQGVSATVMTGDLEGLRKMCWGAGSWRWDRGEIL